MPNAENDAGDLDLPGMWERADFEGGDPDERSYAERERQRKREAAVQAMIAKGYTRERAEYLLFEVVGKALTRVLPPNN